MLLVDKPARLPCSRLVNVPYRAEASFLWRNTLAKVRSEGILLEPKDAVLGQVILVPDAGQTIESLVWQDTASGKAPGTASSLANHGIRVLIPAIIDRTVVARNGRAQLSNREFVYRPAFELGRHI